MAFYFTMLYARCVLRLMIFNHVSRGGGIMLSSVLRFVRLPFLLIAIWAIGRFTLGVLGVPYTPRSNAAFSVVVLTIISCLYYGALSGKIGGFGWGGTALAGVA